MKTIYLFQYQFKQEKRGLLNYKTYIIVNDEGNECLRGLPNYCPLDTKEIASRKFVEKFPHVDFNSVEISIFKGDVIDSYEPAE